MIVKDTGLMAGQKQFIFNNYISIFSAYKLFRKHSPHDSIEDIGEFLGFIKIDKEIPIFYKNQYSQIFEFTDHLDLILDVENPISTAITEMTRFLTIDDELQKDDIKKLEADIFFFGEVSSCLWKKSDFFNFEPIKNLNLPEGKEWINKQSIPEVSNHSVGGNPFLINLDLFSPLQAACLLSGHEPTVIERCLNDTNFDEWHVGFTDALALIESAIKAKQLEIEDSSHRIPSQSLKQYALKKGFIVIGFNDNLQSEPVDNIGERGIDAAEYAQYAQLLEETTAQQAEIDQLRARITELETIQTSEPESKLSTREENNILRVLAVLGEMDKINMSKPHEAHGKMVRKAELLGVNPFPSDESIKKWFARANEYKNPN